VLSTHTELYEHKEYDTRLSLSHQIKTDCEEHSPIIINWLSRSQ